MSDERETPPPWWAGQRARLSVLLACLGAAIAALLVSRTDLLSATGGSGNAAAASTWCVPRGLPEVARAAPGELLELRASVSAVAPRDGRRYALGVALPEDIWSDDDPQTLRATRSAGGRWPAGYEMRWWTPDYDAVADAFTFSQARQAREFFDLAASTRCHRASAPLATTLPPNARELAWTNPDDAEQEDVFLLRGRRVYRVATVRVQRTPAVVRRVDFEFADAMVMTSVQQPQGGGLALRVTRVWFKRNGAWLEAYSYQTTIQAAISIR